MIKRFISILLVFLIALTSLLFVGCSGADPVDPTDPPGQGGEEGGSGGGESQYGYKYVSILQDRKFKKGLNVRGLQTPIYYLTNFDGLNGETIDDSVEGYPWNVTDPYPQCFFQYGQDIGEDPLWNLCQWSTRYPFQDVPDAGVNEKVVNGKLHYRFTDLGDDTYLYENQSKTVKVNTNTGNFTLGLKASECYHPGVPRVNGQEWPHLLFEYKHAGDITKQMSVKNMTELKITLDMTVDSFVDHMGNSANQGLHASCCFFYIFVKYMPKGAETFTNDKIWLGMTLFDNRRPYGEEMLAIDEGSKESATGQLIYNIPGDKYLSADNNVWENGQIKIGKTASIDFDILPYIKSALQKAQTQKNYLTEATMDELYINGMYIGFENTGTYDTQMSFSNMNIKSKIYTKL